MRLHPLKNGQEHVHPTDATTPIHLNLVFVTTPGVDRLLPAFGNIMNKKKGRGKQCIPCTHVPVLPLSRKCRDPQRQRRKKRPRSRRKICGRNLENPSRMKFRLLSRSDTTISCTGLSHKPELIKCNENNNNNSAMTGDEFFRSNFLTF